MDIVITTSEPNQVSANEIIEALEAQDYHVNSVRIFDRNGRLDCAIGRPQ